MNWNNQILASLSISSMKTSWRRFHSRKIQNRVLENFCNCSRISPWIRQSSITWSMIIIITNDDLSHHVNKRKKYNINANMFLQYKRFWPSQTYFFLLVFVSSYKKIYIIKPIAMCNKHNIHIYRTKYSKFLFFSILFLYFEYILSNRL
jgi:hypothetical protein